MFKSREEWEKLFSLRTSSTTPLSCAEAEEELQKLTSALSSKTQSRSKVPEPMVPRPKLVPIKPDPGKTESWSLTAGKDFIEYSIDFQDAVCTNMAAVQESFRNSVKGVQDLSDTINNVKRRLIFTKGRVGSNRGADPGMPFTLWDSTLLLKTMVDKLDDSMTSSAISYQVRLQVFTVA